jgi:MANEC domain
LLYIHFLAEHFDVHTSTIIRTEESKAMGAKFLNDGDVSSSEACMKLCCDTDDCDVFIFEEKVNI